MNIARSRDADDILGTHRADSPEKGVSNANLIRRPELGIFDFIGSDICVGNHTYLS